MKATDVIPKRGQRKLLIVKIQHGSLNMSISWTLIMVMMILMNLPITPNNTCSEGPVNQRRLTDKW